ncbi:winged helix-turn-helix domain-containing protein [Chloroflexus sp. MS-CIW-1]|uniref:winged helix-turn-helix domain-containing protein n=1 Tax=Chloroflexus sp. MS-CIW-1 TaxID=3055768 RepID=UPI003461C652
MWSSTSSKQTVFYNRVGWARTHLTRAGLLEMTSRSYYRITERGKQVLAGNQSITN